MSIKTIKGVGTTFVYKDGFGAGNSATENVVANNVVNDDETYIGGRNNKKLVMNKINHTKVGDDIHYYMNGVEGRGIVVKMSNEYVLVAKEDGDFQDIHISDTFFVKDIVINKTWDNMDSNERTDVLLKAHAPSPRFVTKDWHNLPVELREVLTKFTGSTSEAGISTDDEQAKGLEKGYGDEFKEGGFKQQQAKKKKKKGKKCANCGKVHKSDVEEGAYGAAGGSPDAGVNTSTPLDVSADTGYEERPHICAECVGNLPREDAKGHHDKETDEKKSPAKVKEPHESSTQESKKGIIAIGNKEKCPFCDDIQGTHFDDTTEHLTGKHMKEFMAALSDPDARVGVGEKKEKSEQFRKIYGGGKKRKKGVPEWNVNSWGINYTTKLDEEDNPLGREGEDDDRGDEGDEFFENKN